MSPSARINSPRTYEQTPAHEVRATKAVFEHNRDFLQSIKIRVEHFVQDGMEPDAAEQRAVEEFLERLAQDAEGEQQKYNAEAENLRQRLETMRKQAPEVAPWFQTKLKELQRQILALANNVKKALEDLVRSQESEKKSPISRYEIEDLCEQHLETWIRNGYLAKLVEVTDLDGTKHEVSQGQRMVELIAIVRNERNKINTLVDKEVDEQIFEPLRQAELELLEYEAGVGELEARADVDTFLAQPLTEIHKQLQDGVRHPRTRQHAFWMRRNDYAHRRNKKEYDPRLEYRSGYTEDLVANIHFSEKGADVRQILSTLQNGWSPRFPQRLRDLFVVAAYQMENRAFERASQTLAEAVGVLSDTDKSLPRLVEMQYILEGLAKKPAEETARVSAELYRQILTEEPERENEIRTRQELEETLRTGEILSWRSVKAVKGKSGGNTKEGQITGSEKVFELTIAREGKPALKAFAKSAYTEGYFRDNIPPEQTILMEWQTAQEAVALGTDAVPPTVIRSFSFGEMSVQLYATDMDVSGNAASSVNPGMIEGWEKYLSPQNHEEIALFQLLTAAQDAGEPNHVLTPTDIGLFKARAIDNGLNNGNGRAPLLSCLLAASSARELSPETLTKLGHYERRLDLVNATLKSVVMYDTDPLMKRKQHIVKSLLRTGRFGNYEQDYGGVWKTSGGLSLLRDGGWFAKQYRKDSTDKGAPAQAVNA